MRIKLPQQRLNPTRLAAILAVLAGTDILLSVVYQWYFLRRIGPGVETDALYAGMIVPQLVLVVLTGSLIQVLVPLLAIQPKRTFTQSVWTFVHFVALGLGGIVVIGWLTAALWVPLTVPGFSDPAQLLTVRLVRIQLFGLVLGGVSSVLWTAHQARGHFIWAGLSAVLAGTAGLGFLLWALPRQGVAAAAWVGVLRPGLHALLLLPGVGRYRKPQWRANVTYEAWRRVRPLLVRSVYFKADVVVDRFLGALAPAGALSLLSLSRQLYTAGHQMMNRAVTAPAIPALAQLAQRGAWDEFRRVRNARTFWATAIAMTATLLLAVAGRPALSLFFANSSFLPEQIDQTWRLLLVFSGVWVAGAASQVLAGAFYAQGDTETPTRIGVVSFTVGIGLKVLGFYLFGIWGIAAGASIHYLLMATLLEVAGRRHARATASPPIPESPVGSSDPAYEGDFDLPAVRTDPPRPR